MKFPKVELIQILIIVSFLSCQSQDEGDFIPLEDIKEDLEYLDNFISDNSSYSGLNGFDYQKEFAQFLESEESKKVNKKEFELFLTRVIGKMGDRHAYIRGSRFSNSSCFPLAFAPLEDEVLVLEADKLKRQYRISVPEFPILKSIDGVSTKEFLSDLLPEELKAPKDAYFTRAVRALRDIEKLYDKDGNKLDNPIQITLSNYEKSKDTILKVRLINIEDRMNKWDEKFYREFFYLKEEEFNQSEIIEKLFKFEEGIGYIRIPAMVGKDDAPKLYDYFNQFMSDIKEESIGLIVDVRSNGGGVRDLIFEMAGYFVDPDSIYVVNVAQQRGALPLNEDLKEDMHNRYLYSYDEVDKSEQEAIDKFNASFEPMYKLDNKKYSPFHYAVFNGEKLTKDKYHFDKPIYILANERSFSAATVLVAMFKGLPNIKIAGVNTDGSSGNSERFKLPKSELRGRMSTMVSFQKDGKILDGHGTEPDIKIERDLDQILWKSDTQLEKLREIIKQTATK